jgi:hypothetical protein
MEDMPAAGCVVYARIAPICRGEDCDRDQLKEGGMPKAAAEGLMSHGQLENEMLVLSQGGSAEANLQIPEEA